MYAEWSKANQYFRTWKKYASKKKANHFWKNLIVMTKFPDISLTLVKWPKFPDIFSKFPDNSLTWRKFCFSLTFPWHVATLNIFKMRQQVFLFLKISDFHSSCHLYETTRIQRTRHILNRTTFLCPLRNAIWRVCIKSKRRWCMFKTLFSPFR